MPPAVVLVAEIDGGLPRPSRPRLERAEVKQATEP